MTHSSLFVLAMLLLAGCPGGGSSSIPTPGSADAGWLGYADGSSPVQPDSGSTWYWDTGTTVVSDSTVDAGTPVLPPDIGNNNNNAPAIDPALDGYIDKMYQYILKRAADVAGKQYWATQYTTGVLPSCQQLVKAFVASTEAQNKLYGYSTTTSFVNNAYQALLWRPADAAGLLYWANEINTGTLTRELVVQALIESNEFATTCVNSGLTSG